MPTLQQTVDEATKVLAQTKAQGSKPFKGSSFDTPIPYSTLTSKDTPAEVVTPPPSTQASGLGAGIETMANQNKDAYTQNLAQNAETARAGADTSWEEYMKSVLGTEGETSLTDKAYRSTVDPAQAELNDINNQIIAEQVALRRRVEKAQKENPLGKSAEAIQEQVDQINRESISKQADLAVIQLSKQGKYDSAKAIADRAVSAQFEKQQVKNEALKLNYERNKDLFTTAEQRAFETAQADRERTLEFEMYKKKADYDNLISQSSGGLYGYTPQTGVSFEEYLSQKEQELGINIDPTSPKYAEIKAEYEQGSGASQNTQLMASNIRSLVAKTGPASKIFDNAYNNAAQGGVDSANAFLRSQYINNVLSGSERENYNNVNNGIEMYREAINYLKENPDIKTGFWVETAEGLKPKVGVKNDPRYATLLGLINAAEGPIRKAQYGTAITGTELSLAMRSLLNTDQDRDTTILKMEQAANAYENGLNRNMSNALGTPFQPKQIRPTASQQVAGEDLYNSVVGSNVDYNSTVDQGFSQILNSLFVGY